MKTFLPNFIYPLLISLVTIFVGIYIQIDKTELTYFLSEKIPFSFEEDKQNTDNSIQVLEIKNSGDKPVIGINIKIDTEVLEYLIIKNSKSDIEKVYKDQNSFELDYEQLPVDGSFKVTIVTNGSGVSQNEIIVRHNEGNAVNALDNQSFSFISLVLTALTLLQILYIIKMNRTDSIISEATFNGEEFLKKTSKPLFISNSHWIYLREKAINNFFSRIFINPYDVIESTKIHLFLNSEKPQYLSEEEWNILVKDATNIYIKYFPTETYDTSKILNLMNKSKPLNFPIEKWEKIIDDLSLRYIELLKRSIEFKSFDELKEIPLKPENLHQEYWDKFEKYYYEVYYQNLMLLITDSQSPMTTFKENELQKDDYKNRRAKELAINLELAKFDKIFEFEGANEFLNLDLSDFGYKSNNLTQIAKKTVKLESQRNNYNYLIEFVEAIFEGNDIPNDKPDDINYSEWGNLVSISEKAKYIYENEARLNKIESELEPLIKKVQAQLNIIHIALLDESALTRIEDYNNPFEKGNFENLKKLISAYHKIETN